MTVGKKKKGGGGGGRGRAARQAREPPMAEDGQSYARVVSMLGNGRVKAKFADDTERTCRIRGSMRRREWVNPGDLVLVALREELATDTGDIVFRYQPPEVQRLRRLGEPVVFSTGEEEEDDHEVAFEDDDFYRDGAGGGADDDDAVPAWKPVPLAMPPLEDDDYDDFVRAI